MKTLHRAARVERPNLRPSFSGFLLLTLLLFPLAAHAQTGSSPFDTGLTSIQTLFTGTIAKVSSLIAIVLGGYAVTSHSSQGLTKDRVLVNMDTAAHPELINTRFAYVSVSRASHDARIYTNDVSTLAERLSTDISKTSAVQLETPHGEHHQQPRPSPQPKEHTMTNSNEQTPEEQKRPESELTPVAITLQAIIETDQRHYAPLNIALPNESEGYEWKRETGDIQSYQHTETAGWLHIDPQGQFYDRHAQPIEREVALGQYIQQAEHNVTNGALASSTSSASKPDEHGISL